jgi:hypothetical protein
MVRKLALLFIGATFFLAPSSRVMAQTVTSMTITFATTSDDKDWNSQVRDRVVLNGQDVATLFCCSSDRKSDHWLDHTGTSRQMTIISPISKSNLHGCTFVVGMTAVGRDNWNFIPTLAVTYSDGSKEQWTYPETFLSSDNNEDKRQYSIPPS